MYQVALSVLHHRQDAEDAVQDAIVGLLDRDLDPDPARFNAYACHCARHRAIERWQRSQEGLQRLMVAMPSEEVVGGGDLATDVENRWLAGQILSALAREPACDRLCVTSTPQEAARKLGIPVGTAKSRGFRVRMRVRAAVGGV